MVGAPKFEVFDSTAKSPNSTLLPAETATVSSCSNSYGGDSPASSPRSSPPHLLERAERPFPSYQQLAVLSGHEGSVCCLTLCGEFVLSASQGSDIIVWQQPELRRVGAGFGSGEGSVKAVVASGSKIFTAHQDRKIRMWKLSAKSDNIFRHVNTLPTRRDYMGKIMKRSNYVRTRRHRRCLWIQHADSVSCLAISNGLLYSGSWDKTIKVWRVSDLKCLESIDAHDDAINGLAASDDTLYSASADGKIKAWRKSPADISPSYSLEGILIGHEEVSINAVVAISVNKVVYGGGSDGYLMGWRRSERTDSWKLISEAKAHPTAVLCLCTTGDFLCSGSADNSIGVWKMESDRKLTKFLSITGHGGPVKCLQALSGGVRGGFFLYSGGLDRSLRVWSVAQYSSQLHEQTIHRLLLGLLR